MRRSGRHRQHLFSVRRLGVLTARLQPWTNSRAAASFGGMKSRLATDRQCRRRDTQALKHVMCQASKPPAIAFLKVFRLSPAVSSSSAPSARQRDRARRPACARRPLFSQPAPPLPPCAAPTPAQTRKMACAASSTVRSAPRVTEGRRSRQPGQPAPPGARCGALPRRALLFGAGSGRERLGARTWVAPPRKHTPLRWRGCAAAASKKPAESTPWRGLWLFRRPRARRRGQAAPARGRVSGGPRVGRWPAAELGRPRRAAGLPLSLPACAPRRPGRFARVAPRRGADLSTCFGHLPQSLEKTSTRW